MASNRTRNHSDTFAAAAVFMPVRLNRYFSRCEYHRAERKCRRPASTTSLVPSILLRLHL